VEGVMCFVFVTFYGVVKHGLCEIVERYVV